MLGLVHIAGLLLVFTAIASRMRPLYGLDHFDVFVGEDLTQSFKQLPIHRRPPTKENLKSESACLAVATSTILPLCRR